MISNMYIAACYDIQQLQMKFYKHLNTLIKRPYIIKPYLIHEYYIESKSNQTLL